MESYDILFPIIIRLPVKSLLRFQSVSKLWNTIISDKEFKKIHIDQSKESSPKKLLLVQMNDGVFEFRDLENPQIAIGKQHSPLKRFQNPTALCSCDCLILMKTPMDYNEYALWNPCTNEYQTFVCPYLKGINPGHCGLCYDSSDDDYKVILIYKSFCAVYHVKRNNWMKKTVAPVHEARSRECIQGISVDGCVFWPLHLTFKQSIYSSSTIIYFDVKSNELKELPKPDFIGAKQSFRLTSLKGRIGLCGGSNYSKELNIWIMEQGIWTRLMKINCYNSIFRDQYLWNIVLLGCTRNDEILFQVGRELEHLVIYDPTRHKFVKRVRISNDSKHNIIQRCSESFYFPEPNVTHAQRKQLA